MSFIRKMRQTSKKVENYLAVKNKFCIFAAE